jgi:hypothetical protein
LGGLAFKVHNSGLKSAESLSDNPGRHHEIKGSTVKINHLILIGSLVVLSACTRPIPESKSDYVGEWRGTEMSLQIYQDGKVAYERSEGRTSVSIDARVKEFVGDDFVVGVWIFTTNFDVSVPPEQVDGTWQMVVDGVRLTRVEP